MTAWLNEIQLLNFLHKSLILLYFWVGTAGGLQLKLENAWRKKEDLPVERQCVDIKEKKTGKLFDKTAKKIKSGNIFETSKIQHLKYKQKWTVKFVQEINTNHINCIYCSWTLQC